MACRWQPGMKITALLDALNSALAEPFALAWSQDSPRFLLVFTVIYAVVVIVAVSDQKNTRPGAEHGSAAWGDVLRLNKFYMDRHGSNLLLTQHFHIGIDGYKHKHNTNILIVGGSGAGKTRTYGVPNVLECTCSMVITDPKSEILRKTGNLLEQNGYEVIVFDLINPAASFCYNPFVYVHDDREVLTLIENLIQNTTPSHSKSSDPFWEKSETALLQALMLYLLHEAPPEEQKKPEHALKLFIRFALAKGAVTYGLELMLAVFSIVQGMVSTIITQSGSSGMSSVSLPQELIDAINNVAFWDSIPLWAVTLIGGLLITVLSFTMILTVYGRMFSLWMYAAIAPIPLSTFAGEPTSSVGKNFIRSYAGVCLQGVVIALSCIIFSAISSSPPAVDTGASVVTAVWTYVGELAFNLLVLVGAIKGCDRIVKEIMGL